MSYISMDVSPDFSSSSYSYSVTSSVSSVRVCEWAESPEISSSADVTRHWNL